MKVRLAVLLVVAGLLLLAVVAATGSSGIPTGVGGADELGLGDPGGEVGQAPPVSSEPIALGVVFVIIIVVVLALFGAGVVLFALAGVRFQRRRRLTRLQRPVDGDVIEGDDVWLITATRRAMSALDKRVGGPPADAVVAAWVQLEADAAARGTEREPHQTPTEFTARLLAEHTADRAALQELKSLYHRARFGKPGNVTAGDATAARRALERLAT
jgi:hypothetical protein